MSTTTDDTIPVNTSNGNTNGTSDNTEEVTKDPTPLSSPSRTSENSNDTTTATNVPSVEEADDTAAIELQKQKEEEEEKKQIQLRRKKKEESDELTKRLQKLALERQKESKGERLHVIQSDTSSHLTSIKTFQDLNLPKYLLDAIFAMGFDRPSAIQEEALPRILANPPRDLIGQAQSGSGKTAAFTIGMLYRINIDPTKPTTTQALCVTPTRELAIQIIDKAIRPMAANMIGLKIELAVAGSQMDRSKRSVDAHLIVGTPGKICEWLKRRYINTKTIKVFVLDEADNMIEEGGHRANSIIIRNVLPKHCQTLLFSATFPTEVISFADKIVNNPDKILIERGPEFLVSYFLNIHYIEFNNAPFCIVDIFF
jgi:ATP-dependent RNA helicase DDX19/DBP5